VYRLGIPIELGDPVALRASERASLVTGKGVAAVAGAALQGKQHGVGAAGSAEQFRPADVDQVQG
jgi:hypothetical protein